MRRKLVVGNWKMNGNRTANSVLLSGIVAGLTSAGADCAVCAPAPYLAQCQAELSGTPVAWGAQDMSAQAGGAYTGEVAADMLRDFACRYVILGHSERRVDQGESDADVQAKTVAAYKVGLCSIVCIGETLAQRDAGETLAVIARQIAGSLPEGLDSRALVIAYEPVWAIGTGRTPTVEQVADVHGHIRRLLAGKATDPAAVRILYGGSVKPSNAKELMSVANVDGALVGGASLIAADFWAIVEACG